MGSPLPKCDPASAGLLLEVASLATTAIEGSKEGRTSLYVVSAVWLTTTSHHQSARCSEHEYANNADFNRCAGRDGCVGVKRLFL